MVLATQPVVAQGQNLRFSYATKIVCGTQAEATGQGAVPQTYVTSINVHNANDSSAVLQKRLLVTIPPDSEKQVVAEKPLASETMNPRAAFGTDCWDFRRLAARQGIKLPRFFEGFVVLDSQRSLDVVAVYTVAGGIDVVHVPERIRGSR
jgi:hypothetical protein